MVLRLARLPHPWAMDRRRETHHLAAPGHGNAEATVGGGIMWLFKHKCQCCGDKESLHEYSVRGKRRMVCDYCAPECSPDLPCAIKSLNIKVL